MLDQARPIFCWSDIICDNYVREISLECDIEPFRLCLKAGNKSDEISHKAYEFFTKDYITKAKEILWSSAHYTNINEILKVLELCKQRNDELPVFAIVEPGEVPICPGEIAAVITRKVIEVCNKLDNFMNKDPPIPLDCS